MAWDNLVAGPRTYVGQPGPERTLLAEASRILEPQLDRHVASFYATLRTVPQCRRVLHRLAPQELYRMQVALAGHLRAVIHPDTSREELMARGRDLGRVHALAGLELDEYVDAAAEHQREVYQALLPHQDRVDCAAVTVALNERFMLDLHGTLQGYRDVDQAQNDALIGISRVAAEARTVADLTRGVLELLVGLDDLAMAFVTRPDEHGVFVFEAGAGEGVEEFITATQAAEAPPVLSSPSSPEGRGPSGRAWRTGHIVACDDYLVDPATEPWRDWALRLGWRSSAAVPLMDDRGRPIALLSLYALRPGYFTYPSRVAMLEQVRQIVQRSLGDLQADPAVASGVRGYVERTNHLALLGAGEVEMLYQPVVSLVDGRLLKLEALARLRDGDRLVGPAEFLPTFGDEDLLRLFEIGLEQSLRASHEWEAYGVRCGVSVNLPVAAATDGRYVEAVHAAIGRGRVAPDRLTLELLETGDVVGSLAQRRESMDQFKRLGVRLAQDDLGSGYSSLLRLRHFAFDEVKIDQNLVRGTDFAPRAALHFVQPIADIARSLGLVVVLEGLENEGLIEAARQLGVDGGQGYGIARPMPASAVPRWADGFRLDLDLTRPRTHLGALAAHVAWEHRVTAVGNDPARRALLATDACALSAYLAVRPGAQLLAEAHDAVHEATLSGRGSEDHRARWERLVSMLDDG